MQDKEYINMAINTFRDLQRKYDLKLTTKDTVLNYSNTGINFSVYFEKSFEIYICFHLNHMDLRLYDIVTWLGFEKSYLDLVIKNQVANENNTRFVLKNLHTVLAKLLDILQKKPELLIEFLKDKRTEKQNTLSDAKLSLIRQAWDTKEFEDFLVLVELNRADIENTKNAKLIFKQEAYLKKITGIGQRE